MRKLVLLLFGTLVSFFVWAQDDANAPEFAPEYLSDSVNTPYDELGPVVSPDGKTLFFVINNHPQNAYGSKDSQDIWFSECGSTGKWQPARRMGEQLNNNRYNFIQSVSPDGNTLLISNNARNRGKRAHQYFFCYKTRTGWSQPQPLYIENYERLDNGIFVKAFLANDGKHLLLSFSEERNSVINDLYVSTLKADSTWTEPVTLGDSINTEADETTPFLASDGVTLYFSSNRAGGFGSHDIYFSKRLDDTWQRWSTPRNAGNAINTDDWDAYYAIDAAGDFAYLVSYKNTRGDANLVRMRLKTEVRPNPVVLVTGNVYNAKTKEPMEAGIDYELLPVGGSAGKARSNPVSGEYTIVLPYGNYYGFSAFAEGYAPVSDTIDLSQIARYREIRRDLYLSPIEQGQTIRLNNLFFDFSQVTLREESFPELDRLLALLQKNTTVEIEIAGHTDDKGSDEFNLKLSEARAQAVKDYLTDKGISDQRISVQSYGETKPVADNNTEENQQLNRRVEFTVLKK